MFSRALRGGKSPAMGVGVSTGGACGLRSVRGVPGADAASGCV